MRTSDSKGALLVFAWLVVGSALASTTGAGDVTAYTLDPAQPVIPIVLDVAWSIDESQSHVASIRDSSGGIRWRMDLSSATLRRQSMSNLPSLFVPTDALPPGLYDLEIAIDGELFSSFVFLIKR